MAIILPDLHAESSARLIACGALQTDSPDVLKWLETSREMIAGYSRRGVRHFVRLITGGKKKKHFHLEVALADWFPSDLKPQTTHKLSEVETAVNRVLGERIDLNIGATFPLEFDELPETGPIRLLSAETRVAGTTIQLTAGVLTVSGSRIKKISWEQVSKEKVMITLRARLESRVQPKYLLEANDVMERFFKVLVLARPSTESK